VNERLQIIEFDEALSNITDFIGELRYMIYMRIQEHMRKENERKSEKEHKRISFYWFSFWDLSV
jgi:hypothetical protein